MAMGHKLPEFSPIVVTEFALKILCEFRKKTWLVQLRRAHARELMKVEALMV